MLVAKFEWEAGTGFIVRKKPVIDGIPEENFDASEEVDLGDILVLHPTRPDCSIGALNPGFSFFCTRIP